MINAGVITSALYNAIVAAGIAGLRVSRGERINMDPAATPWCGVYPATASSKAHTLGGGSNRWLTTGQVQAVIQTASFQDDGQEASDLLESLALTICSAINGNLSLGVSGLRIAPGVDREYGYILFDSDGAGSVFMPQLVLKFNFEYRSSGS